MCSSFHYFWPLPFSRIFAVCQSPIYGTLGSAAVVLLVRGYNLVHTCACICDKTIPLVESVYPKNNFIISQPKHIL